jgi:PAS domain S-box-containing protein
MKIQTKISSLVLMVILIMGASVTTITALVSQNMIKQEIYNRLENVAASWAHNIETLLNEEKELIEMLATDQAFVKAVTTQNGVSANERINTLIQVYDDISRIRILDKQGNVVASSHLDIGIDIKGNAEIFAHGKEGVYIRDIHISTMTDTIVFSISAPIHSVNGEFAGIVITNIEAEADLYKITTDRTGLGETGEIYLINKEGYMITPSRFVEDTFLKQKVNSPEAREWLELSEKEAEIERVEIDIYENYRARQVIGTHRTIQGIQWCLLAEMEVEEALAPVNQLVRIMLWCFVIFAGVGIILTIFITETITHPIMVLHTRAQKIKQGDWDCQFTLDTKDEVGQLSKAFDRMTAYMKESHQALQRHRDELEKKVAERTAELAQHLETSRQQKQVIQEIALDLENTNERLILEIDERKQAEAKLRDSEERFRKIFEEGPLGMIIVNPHYQLVKPNKAFCQMLGYQEQELVRFTIADITHPEDMPNSQKQIKQLVNGKVPSFQQEKRYLKKDGLIVWGNITVSCFHDDNNVPLYFLGMVEDITERKHADQKLRESETRIRTILENIVDGVITINEQGIIESFNRAAEQIFGYPVEEVLGQNVKILMPEPYRSQHDNYLKKSQGVHITKVIGVVGKELQGQHKEGSIFPLDLAVSEMWLGNQRLFVGIVRNITERKQTEIVLKQAKEQAESANRAKSEFLANMSHEIRTPLNAVIGFSELLSTLVTEKKQKNYLDSIQTAGKSLLTLINDILDLSKIEAGHLEFQYDIVNPRVIFNELQQIFAIKIAEKQLAFIVDIDEQLPLTLMLDETRLRQVLLNLIGNAIKFTERGYIRLLARQASHTDSKVDFIITVEDTGIGIPEEQQDIIFDSFRQQDGQSTRKYGGTGLGLTITKRLVEMMNGQISLKSTLGKGSVFEIILQNVEVPATNANQIEDNTLDLQSISFKKACVLVVDDIESNRTLLKEWLSQTNLEVIEADDGQSALFFVSEYHPNLILMDIRMPGIDGYEATKQIKANPATQGIPVIAVTASLVTAAVQTNIEASGFDGYLPKPVNVSQLFTELSHHLEYTQKQAQPTTETEATVKLELLKEPETIDVLKLTLLMDTLEKNIMPIWKELEGVIETEVIDDFAKKLIVLGKEYNMLSFSHYGESLHDCAAEFNIAAIQETLAKFPAMVEQLQRIIDNG